ncbi:MAG: hypothetical protein LIQ30_02465 [Planctomycetes bacterium]|nr:hypothetical protein [Planctomycetota bacterium]
MAASLSFSPAGEDGVLAEDREIVRAVRRDGPDAVLSRISGLDAVADAAILGQVTREYWQLTARSPAAFCQD